MQFFNRFRVPGAPEGGGDERWLITYADMITLLLVLFIILYSTANLDLEKFRALADSLAEGFGATAPSQGTADVGSPIFDTSGGGASPIELFPENQTPISIFDFAERLEGAGEAEGDSAGGASDLLGELLAAQGGPTEQTQTDPGGEQGQLETGEGQRDAGDQGAGAEAAGETAAGQQAAGEQGAGQQDAGELDPGMGQRDAGELGVGADASGQTEAGAGQQVAGDRGAGEDASGETDPGAGQQDTGDMGAGERAAGEDGEQPGDLGAGGPQSQRQGGLLSDINQIIGSQLAREGGAAELGELPYGAQLEFNERGIRIIIFPGDILFESGSAVIKQEFRQILDLLAPYFRKMENRIEIQGHTDSDPISTARYPSNWELSAGRAGSVIRYLINHGVPRDRLQAAGYADTIPRATNATREGKAQNRRVEFLVLHDANEADEWQRMLREYQAEQARLADQAAGGTAE